MLPFSLIRLICSSLYQHEIWLIVLCKNSKSALNPRLPLPLCRPRNSNNSCGPFDIMGFGIVSPHRISVGSYLPPIRYRICERIKWKYIGYKSELSVSRTDVCGKEKVKYRECVRVITILVITLGRQAEFGEFNLYTLPDAPLELVPAKRLRWIRTWKQRRRYGTVGRRHRVKHLVAC